VLYLSGPEPCPLDGFGISDVEFSELDHRRIS
jgi:hypothetical protein